MSLPIVIIGAGGHAVVIADCLLAAGERVIGFTDSDPTRHGQQMCELPILGDDSVLARYSSETLLLANGIGGVGQRRFAAEAGNGLRRAARRAVQERLSGQGWRFASVRHPSAVVSRFARFAEGTQLLAGSVVQARANLGEGCIVNTAAVVEHDVELDPWVHVAPRAVLCGNVRVGSGSHIGAGAVVLQGVSLGKDMVVAAGAVVVNDFTDDCVVGGVPARVMERRG